MKPILKWVGGKTQLLDKIRHNMPNEYNRYFEPFVGGGAILFNIEPNDAYINDLNTELINVYKMVKKHPKELMSLIDKHKENYSKDYYYEIREMDRSPKYVSLSDVEKAARIIYLNKTCFNGLYRVNKKGQFNVPFGKRTEVPGVYDESNIKEVSRFFKNNKVKIYNEDFEIFLKKTKENDFVYLDPPYHPVSDSSSFTDYQKGGFNREEQIRLKKVCDELDKKGVKFIQSNSFTSFIYELYKDYHIEKVLAKRSINSDGEKRNQIEEVLIMNYRK